MAIARAPSSFTAPASIEVITAVLQAAADAMGVSTGAVQPAIVAACPQAAAQGADVGSVLAAFSPPPP